MPGPRAMPSHDNLNPSGQSAIISAHMSSTTYDLKLARARHIRRGRWLEYFTVGWNLLEALMSVAAGVSRRAGRHTSSRFRTPGITVAPAARNEGGGRSPRTFARSGCCAGSSLSSSLVPRPGGTRHLLGDSQGLSHNLLILRRRAVVDPLLVHPIARARPLQFPADLRVDPAAGR